jgi:hypothetical protein
LNVTPTRYSPNDSGIMLSSGQRESVPYSDL